MQRPWLFLYLITISLSSAAMTAQAQHTAPQKYLIKPLNLSINSEIRARSTRNVQIRVTDENDRPVPDAPVIFLLNGANTGNVGSFAGQPSLRVLTNAQGVAQVEYTAGDLTGNQAHIKAQVEGSDAIWEATLLIISALAEGPPPPKTTPSFSKLVLGQLPKSSVARQTYTTTNGDKISLQSRRGKVVVLFFFGVWCDASKRQLIAMKDFREKDKSEEVQIIGMSVKDPRSTPQVFQQLITDQNVNYPVVKDVEDKYFMRLVNSNEVSVPQTLVYAQDGHLIGHFLGFNQQIGTEIERIIKAEFVKK